MPDRIARLRDACLNGPVGLGRCSFYRAEGASRCPEGAPLIRRSAAATVHLFDNVPVEIKPDELIVGSSAAVLSATDKDQWEELERYHGFLNEGGRGGMTAHMAIDNDRLLKEGTSGTIARIERKLSELDPADPVRRRKAEFYDCARSVLEGMVRFANRYADEAERLAAAERDPARKEELQRIAQICRGVPEHPAESFRQALQSVYFLFMATTAEAGLMSLGRADQYLLPYYEADVASGALTRDDARELFGCFFIKTNEWHQAPQSLMIGGQTREGKSAVSELSYLFLDALEDVRMTNPALGAAIAENTPEEFLIRCAELNCRGISFPALFNDRTIIPGLVRNGVRPEDARRYLHCTCTEITPEGCSGIWVVADYINFAKCLELALNDAVPATFADLVEAVKQQLATAVKDNAERQNILARARMEGGRYPLLSCFVNDCIEKGLDLDEGGARYYYFYPQLVGLATVTDSLAAIRELVFEAGEVSIEQLNEALRTDFADAEDLRLRLLNKPSKYGNDDLAADDLAVELAEFYMDEVEKYENPYGAGYHPGFLAWIMHGIFGKETGATPDGRRSGAALSDSLAAAQGRAANGPTGVLATVEKLDLTRAVGAVVVNLTFSEQLLNDSKAPRSLAAMIRSHFNRGGFEVQINCASRETLLAAKADPESYRDLMVRVGGYSDYFTRLDPVLQDEIIQRTE
ncbi:MAG: hypothetical protein HQ592_08070 [Planctomycetes bacterium]|nr:hypothetical protein [Planctomycetota bacterium]